MLLLSCTLRRVPYIAVVIAELAAENIPSKSIRLNAFDRGAPTERSVGAFGRLPSDTTDPRPARPGTTDSGKI